MNKIAINQKINRLEVQIKLLKTAVTQRPNFDIDEKNWKIIKPELKKARMQVAKEMYG